MDKKVNCKFNKNNTYKLLLHDKPLVDILVTGKDIQEVSIYSPDNKEYFEIGMWRFYFRPVPMTMYAPNGPFRFSFYAESMD